MTNAAHTPGPWAIQRHYDAPNTYTPFITVGPATVHFVQGYHTVEQDAERCDRAEADARLIAEAPAMLEALRELVENRTDYLHPDDVEMLGAILDRIDGGR